MFNVTATWIFQSVWTRRRIIKRNNFYGTSFKWNLRRVMRTPKKKHETKDKETRRPPPTRRKLIIQSLLTLDLSNAIM